MAQTRDIRLVKQPAPDPLPYYSRSWALVVGIDHYRDPSVTLGNARNDAAAVAALLRDLYNFDQIDALYDAEATRGNIMAALRDTLPARVQPNDRLVIFFAGHGTTRTGSSGQKHGYLIPHDAQLGHYADYVDMAELRDACGWIPAKHILIILDCCFSGIAAVTARTTLPPAPAHPLTDTYIRHLTARGAWQVLTAGAHDELVADSGSRPGHSAFTSALLTGLQGAADQNQDGVITASDLASFVKPAVSLETTAAGGKGQIPFFGYLAGSDQGDFVLVKAGETPRLSNPPAASFVLPRGRAHWKWSLLAAVLVISVVVGWVVWKGAWPRTSTSPTVQASATSTPPASPAVPANDGPAANHVTVGDMVRITTSAESGAQVVSIVPGTLRCQDAAGLLLRTGEFVPFDNLLRVAVGETRFDRVPVDLTFTDGTTLQSALVKDADWLTGETGHGSFERNVYALQQIEFPNAAQAEPAHTPLIGVTTQEGDVAQIVASTFAVWQEKALYLRSGEIVPFTQISSIDIGQVKGDKVPVTITFADNSTLAGSLVKDADMVDGETLHGTFLKNMYALRQVTFPVEAQTNTPPPPANAAWVTLATRDGDVAQVLADTLTFHASRVLALVSGEEIALTEIRSVDVGDAQGSTVPIEITFTDGTTMAAAVVRDADMIEGDTAHGTFQKNMFALQRVEFPARE